MHQYLNRFSPHAFALLRIVAGLLFLQHGAQKLFGLLGGFGESGGTAPLLSLMGLAGVIEFFGGLLIALGLFAGWAAFVASGQMAVAYFMAHAPRGFFPIQNGGELAALYCFIFLYVAARGAGIWSIDEVMGKRGGSGPMTQ
ncbi:MAG TPA: DoxX family protein [Vicinamibacteria bacterium]